jgi:predicted phosphodiesterase
LKKRVIKEFRDQGIDIIAYGHSHEAEINWKDQILLVNPGRGYIDKFSYNSVFSNLHLCHPIDQKIRPKHLKLL